MESLVVKNLCKTYIANKKQNNVLRNVNFDIKFGEMVAIMGPSGSGKTTLMYTVSGMDKMTAGSVEFFGRELEGLSDTDISRVRLVEMGFVFQQMYMLKNLSVYDNIILPGYKAYKDKKKRKEINEYANKLMSKLEISEIADNDITEVSGGQLQRACICRSLINRPKIIFADEPTGALNRQASKEVMQIFNDINEEGTSIMLVTHDVSVAARCEKVMYIEDGIIKDSINLGKYREADNNRNREKQLSNWLMDLGW
ncbi:ABC transporter ATP-binding protein [Clostridium sp. MSJ-8]|uniref:ABC transporter ATP-binding protein n=1 Tax=Clostridium sp. MSJ-8 TaxID=2841510 RepID=UPI001C0F38AD|nr:ABC transporter ATP-binding protein [Clostridium sp. MSJ-8]MBU5486575.1 ABC transporter ATP-binding protein [Clostridium sp. MSJ-8]